ncbi:D-beta-hydroxybutyrate dehydrogenase-like [Saccoglossus kowalevskii]|uniref:3-oxoacyl-[acyl-carrier-protein] reductase n=1 Tax=Saccoglossus kowalevskii TaxID=10224 RepID=A0ABM0GRJ0_SACKO|nr:PREDICTED: 3-oxoacyl-[acyl-carrier-protein] reductase, chloroplastic-like [Saccoglossus kowalevskii]
MSLFRSTISVLRNNSFLGSTLSSVIKRRIHTGIQGKVALVTGSSDKDGIGMSIARSLAKRGCSVVLHGTRDVDKVEAMREELQSECEVPVHYLCADFDKMNEVEGLHHKIKDLYSDGIDILVNNVGVLHYAPVEEFGIDIWEKNIRINLTSAFYLTSLSLSQMKKTGWGRIINISSIFGINGLPNVASLVATKHGMHGLTKTVALETSGSGITCNAICPSIALTASGKSFMKTGAGKSGMTVEEFEKMVITHTHPSGKPLDVSKIGELAAFLCSPAADEVTGTIIPIDWGTTAK